MKIKFLIGLDYETVGLKEIKGGIVEVGICLMQCRKKKLELIGVYSELMKPKQSIQDGAAKASGITNKMMKNLAPMSTFFNKVIRHWKKCYPNHALVGQNLSFERKWTFAQNLSLFMDTKYYYDTMLQIPHPKGLKKFPRLIELAEEYLPKDNALTFHRALDDAIMSCQVAYKALIKKKIKPINEKQLLQGLKR